MRLPTLVVRFVMFAVLGACAARAAPPGASPAGAGAMAPAPSTRPAPPGGPGAISGEFRDPTSRAPLVAVEVVARRAADSTVVAHVLTGEDGRFRLDGLPLDRYLLRATLLGYRPYARADVTLTDTAPTLDIGAQTLTVSPVEIEGVTTSTARSTVIVAPDRNLYLTKDMPAATAGTATDVLRAVPELDVDMDGKVSLRGSSSVTVQLNGRPMPMTGDALATFLRQFPANRIERVEVIANPSAKYDPEGVAGIVNIVLKDNADLGLSGSVSLNAGNRSNGGSTRVAYQRGPLTTFAGLSGNLNRNGNAFDDLRQNLLSTPLSYYQLHSANEFTGGFGMADGSADWALSKRSTAYASFNAYLNANDTDGATEHALLDSAFAATSRYNRDSDGNWDARAGNATLGYRRVVTPDKNEWTLELRQNLNTIGTDTRSLKHVWLPEGAPEETSLNTGATGTRERSLQFDDARPLGARGKLEAGYRGSERRNTNTSGLVFFHGDTLVVTPQSMVTDYVHREVFHTGYLTVGSTFGNLSLQGGLRAEAANTDFDVRSAGTHYDNDYRSVFPSANVAYDFGHGRVARVTYSKRIERPSAYLLNPDVPALDPLNRTAGNPQLKPKYTHSLGLEGSWSGSSGTLRLSPYYRETVDNWDQYKIVDSTGAALTTWRNAASVRAYGANLTVSLRQTGRLGGSASVDTYRERHDASNLSTGARQDANLWSANANGTYKVTSILDVQGSVRFNPAQTLAQGRISALTYSNIGARLKLSTPASLNLWINDPFNVWRYKFVTHDETHVQTSTNRYTMRRVVLSFTYSYGKPPEQKQRRTTTEQPTQEPGVQIH